LRRLFDLGLVLVTDRALCFGRALEDVVQAAVRGGVTAVQLREKHYPMAEFISLASRLKSLLGSSGVPLIINDRVDVALASGADGVHLGQRDISVSEARRRLGPDAVIGLSVETMTQALNAESLDVEYLGVSPIFSTPTKPDAGMAWGLEGLRSLRARTRHVLVAIGGIDASNADGVLAAGADGLAVVSAICASTDPEAAARRLRNVVDRFRMRRGTGP
jgi:thiamine-phosphate pyrophosphorylase